MTTEPYVEALRKSLKEVERLRRQNEQLVAAAVEPMAVVGIGCRFPGGVSSPEALWDLVEQGRDAVGGFPDDRGWDFEALGGEGRDRSGASEGGFLDRVADFDAGFFGISPREAAAMDPQQRVLLETSWEALERAGIDPQSLHGSRTGVFFGTTGQDYGELVANAGAEADAHAATGLLASVLSGRVSYSFGFEGPSVTIDTGCSSSLVSLQLAAQALRNGECSLALAGGVTIMATPSGFIEFTRQGGLAPDGRCKSFADAADGTGWSEGAGVLVVERLSDAQRHGHEVLAVLRGGAVNSDGASNGLTAPNGLSQQRVIKAALANAGLTPADIDAVEGHGTGTTLGDPIEAQALLAVYGPGREPGRPLWIGSVKSNLAHTQGAAGAAAVIKMIMAMRHGVLPPTLHVDAPSTHVNWSTGGVSVLTERREWPATGRPRRCGVSSFGISGTNAHVILEQAPVASVARVQAAPTPAAAGAQAAAAPAAEALHNAAPAAEAPHNAVPAAGVSTNAAPAAEALHNAVPAAAVSINAVPAAEALHNATPAAAVPVTPVPVDAADHVLPWLLSGRTERGLRAQARSLLAHLAEVPDQAPADTAFSLATTRASLERRAVVVGAGREALLAGVRALAEGDPAPGLAVGSAARTRGAVLVFPGQGSQWLGMGAGLLKASPAFAARIAECEEALRPFTDWSLTAVLRGDENAADLGRVDVAQPALWAMMVSLAAVWRAHGVEPAAVIGHSQGEIAAACVAGGLSLSDGARVVAVRSQAIARTLSGHGGMVSVTASHEDVLARLKRWDGKVSVAAVNGPSTVVVSGDVAALDELLESGQADGVRAKRIAVDYASHSAHVDALHDELASTLAPIEPRSSGVPFFSTVTGDWIDTAELGAGYWFRNLRGTVQLEGAVRSLLGGGHDVFIEASPHPVLSAGLQDTIDAAGATEAVVLGSLRRDDGGRSRLLTALAEAHVHGVRVDWRELVAGGSRVDLPTYAFQRERHWLEPQEGSANAADLGLEPADHPMLGAALGRADTDGVVLTGRIGLKSHPWLGDHVVLGAVVVPDTAFAEWAMRAGDEAGCGVLDELTVHRPLVLDGRDSVQVQVVAGAAAGSALQAVAVYSRRDSRGPWICHATATMSATAAAPAGPAPWPPEGAQQVDVGEFLKTAETAGHEPGPAFRNVVEVWRRDEDLFVRTELPEDLHPAAARFAVHPALLQTALAAGLATPGDVSLPSSWRGAEVHATGATALRLRLSPDGHGGLSVAAEDLTGARVLTVASVRRGTISADQLAPAGPAHRDALFQVQWVPAPVGAAEPAGDWAVVGTGSAMSTVSTVERAGVPVVAVPGLDELGTAGEPVPDLVLLPVASDPADGVAAAAHTAVRDTLAAVQTFLREPRFDGARLVVLTRQAVAAGPAENVAGLADAGVWGLVRSAQSENPGRITLVDIDEEDSSAKALVAAVTDAVAADEPQLALRCGTATAPRLVRARTAEEPAGWQLDPTGSGTVLVTGGTGTLGALLCRHLVGQHGIRRLLVTSRRGLDATGARALRDELTGLGAEADIVSCDTANREELAGVLAGIPAEHPLSSVVHLAGVLDDGVLDALTGERVDKVLEPKVDAALNLHELTRELNLSAFVLFSSFSGVSGAVGQANYAAANTFLDALSQQRRVSGLPATSLAWGFWAQRSELTGQLDETDLARFRREGVLAMTAGQGLALFDLASTVDDSLVVTAPLELRSIARDGVPSLFRGLVRPAVRRAAGAETGRAEPRLLDRLAGLSAAEQENLVLGLVNRHVAAVLGHGSPDDVESERGFIELGMTSLTAVELRNRLAADLGVRLPVTLIFDHPTPLALVRHVRAELGADAGPVPLLAELEKLETAVSAAEPDAAVRAQLVKRLSALQWRLEATDAPGTPETGAAEELTEVSDDEMFAFIDQELGRG
ncbi:Ketoacyl-synthetase C-terminal extension [Amycolatopsis saalfeldensis]|uniref:6-deoxyerythronolide-B synthase n=2 Tax=Amycolatopsis saalfeldensis TaxID=394193 RepID=A0A1H8SG28_9PSEU|nr:type I polyketide synthase [Amycolatopsis saalfeldensis]SEO77535.1 Ketoacyl-synthetase C-terminal extension [Amycolatopsis saalfeldensis]